MSETSQSQQILAGTADPGCRPGRSGEEPAGLNGAANWAKPIQQMRLKAKSFLNLDGAAEARKLSIGKEHALTQIKHPMGHKFTALNHPYSQHRMVTGGINGAFRKWGIPTTQNHRLAAPDPASLISAHQHTR